MQFAAECTLSLGYVENRHVQQTADSDRPLSEDRSAK